MVERRSDIERVQALAGRLLELSSDGDKDILRRVERYILRLESHQSSRRDASPIPTPCSELKRYRLKLGLSQPSLALLASIYGLMAEQNYHYGEITAHLHSLKNNRARLDVTHLSKFETGSLVPWNRAQVLLAETISILSDEPVSPRELFPDLAWEPRCKGRNQHLTRAALEGE